jgi:hypothetical protein
VKIPVVAESQAVRPAALHTSWLEAALGAPIPSEPHATCENCAMLAVPGESGHREDDDFFNPKTKCCTYTPKLPNFLVGAILDDNSPEMAAGRALVVERIRRKVAVTPLGVSGTNAYALLYGNGPGLFGHSGSMRCPYYLEDVIGGGCGIWRHRNSVCRTWFCKHDRGGAGKRFWDAANELLMEVESTLAIHALVTLGFEDAALSALFPVHSPPSAKKDSLTVEDLDGIVAYQRYAKLWGRWNGREEKLYLDCHEIVRDLSWAEVSRIGGARIELLERLARAAFREATSSEIPERLEIGSFEVLAMDGGTTRMATYSTFDPIDAPAALLDVLPFFDGSTVPDVVRTVRKKLGISLRPALIRKLVDYGLLRAADGSSQSR